MPHNLAQHLDFLVARIHARLQAHLQQGESLREPEPPPLAPESTWTQLVQQHELTQDEQSLLLLALVPFLRPQVLDIFPSLRQAQHQPYAEFGGQMGTQHAGFLPTIETALFILAGNDLEARWETQRKLLPESKLLRHGLLQVDPVRESEPDNAALLRPSSAVLDHLLHGASRPPKFGPQFPARKVQTELDWDALVLPANSLRLLKDLLAWLEVGDVVMRDWGMGKRLAPGYKALFHGPPGTGKTLTAKLLGRHSGREVFRIDLSAVVSKYIGETEKNLERVFSQAERQGWILFFDEADALFGKRTRVSDAHDRYANQEVSYLLQRLEDYDGLVILASNEKENIDEAFTRRFQATIHFPMPTAEERLRIWTQAIPEQVTLESDAMLPLLANRFELAGGHIMNIVRYAAMKAAARHETVLRVQDFETGLQQELHKMGKWLG